MVKEYKIFAGNSNPELAKKIAAYLKVPLGKIDVGPYLNKETRVEILESVRKKDVFIIQSTCPPVNDNLMELLIMIDAFKRASCGFVTAIIPYFGYSKQDKKKTGREPITAKLVANLLVKAGVDRVVTLELHSDPIQGFFDIPVDDLKSVNLMGSYFEKKNIPNLVVVSPDVGGTKRARDISKRLNAGLVIIDKYRPNFGKAYAMNVIGDVKNKTALIVDDLIDTGGTIVEAVHALEAKGARKVYIYCTHPLLTPPAVDRLKHLNIEEFVTTDTVPIPKDKMLPNFKIISTGDLFGETIKRILKGESVIELFKNNHRGK